MRRILTALLLLGCAIAALGIPALAFLEGSAPAPSEEPSPSFASFEESSSAPAPPYVRETERVERVAAALREAPLFVDPEAAHAVSAEEREELAELLGTTDHPVYVAVLPLPAYGESGRNADLFLHALHHELGEDGIYIAAEPPEISTGPFALTTLLFNVPIDELTVLYPEEFEEPPGHDAHTAAAKLLTEQLTPVIGNIEAAPSDDPESPSPDPAWFDDSPGTGDPPDSYASDFVADLLPGVIVGALISGLALAVVLPATAAVRFCTGVGPRPFEAREDHLPALLRARRAPARPSHRRLAGMLRAELRRLARGLRSAPHEHPGHAGAVAAFDAAALISRGGHDDQWLVGAITMVRRARAALTAEGAPGTYSFCVVNPLHGAALDGREEGRRRYAKELPHDGPTGAVCARCAGLHTMGPALKWALLRLRIGGERTVHYRIPGFWRSLGYGRDIPDLPQRVLKELDVD
ncbi:MAG: hypothetical protein M0026_09335 [Nocardiopsaceae bacterium]|nr:hypothetical protein [Nocardiopsaceae bacterium]